MEREKPNPVEVSEKNGRTENFWDALQQVALQHINFCTVQSIAKLPTGAPKMMPAWLFGQHFDVSIESPL
ncbi:hypothetical protein TNCV_371691 [Trichonephila clavipes]|nr:hypothetical protein TNCV_371691 [Trichonephila clavipes]